MTETPTRRGPLTGLPRPSRAFVADTVALLCFFTLTGVLNERFVAGMDWPEVARARAIGAPLMVLTARPYGIWRDWLLGRFAGATRTSRLAWDSLALMVFQVPLYGLILWAGGATGRQILIGCLGAAVIMLASGRPYGLWLDFVRSHFGLPPGGMRPMTLQE